MTPLCWERLRTGYIHSVLRQKGWPPEAEKHHNIQELSTHQPASTWVTQICSFKLVQARLHRHLAVVILKLRTYDCSHEGLPPMHGANLSGWIVSFRRKSIQNFHGPSPRITICHHLSKCHWNYRARIHKCVWRNMKNTLQDTNPGLAVPHYVHKQLLLQWIVAMNIYELCACFHDDVNEECHQLNTEVGSMARR